MQTRRAEFETLIDALRLAHSQVDALRRVAGSQHVAAAAAQRELLGALEKYVEAIGRAGRPVPYRLRDELAMHRALAGVGSRGRRTTARD